MRRQRWTKHRPLFASPVPSAVQKPRMKWKILPILWLAFKRASFVIGASVIVSAFIGVYAASMVTKPAAPSLPDKMVVFHTFEDTLLEIPAEATFADPFTMGKPTVRQVVDALDKAAADPRVEGFLARLNKGSFSLAHIQEIRAAVKRFRAAGKFAYIYSSSFGESAGGLGRYYLAAAFEERWMQPMGVVYIGGVKAEVPYLRETLDKIGVTPDFYQRKEYKTAMESLTRKTITPQNKQMMQNIVDTIRDTILADVPADIDMSEREFSGLIDTGLFPANEAAELGLITHADYADVLVRRINEDITGDPDTEEEVLVALSYYAGKAKDRREGLLGSAIGGERPKVALVYAVGSITDTAIGAAAPAMPGDGIAAADEIVPAIMEASDDEEIEAIVLRVDSPGGSPVASESILRALERAKEKGKPVVVSMGPTAASGGYWISAYADRIYALPTTLTGSIGVVGGKFSAAGLWDKIGVNWDTGAQWGRNAGMWSFNSQFTPSEAQRIGAMLDQVYDGFTARVAKGRNMSAEEVEKIAGGRVWTGRDAVKAGLVDELGGLDNALDYAAGLADAKDRHAIEIIQLPKPKSAFEQIIDLLGESGTVYEGLRLQAALMRFFQPVLQEMALVREQPALTYEPLRVE